MIFPCPIINENVIKKRNKFTKERPKDIIHQTLEYGRGISEIERHNYKFVVAFMSVKGSFLNIPLMDSNLVVTGTQISF